MKWGDQKVSRSNRTVTFEFIEPRRNSSKSSCYYPHKLVIMALHFRQFLEQLINHYFLYIFCYSCIVQYTRNTEFHTFIYNMHFWFERDRHKFKFANAYFGGVPTYTV